MRLFSSAFADHDAIPRKYTCDGEDLSPPLAWSDVPPGAKSLALVVDDPDAPDPSAPTMVWVHWVLYNIPCGCSGLAEGVRALPAGTREGLNDWWRTGYGGPCPPAGRHRYFHKLYALDALLPDLRRPTRRELEAAMRRHGLAAPGGACLVSTARLAAGADEGLFRARLVKEAVHELGHTLGLEHCADPGCVMHFSNRLADTDRKGDAYCSRCAAAIRPTSRRRRSGC